MAFLKKCLLFCIGGAAYVGLELLWRGYSHISMFAAGGVCFLLIGQLGQAIANGMTPGQLLAAMRPHPTYEEALSEALESLAGKL